VTGANPQMLSLFPVPSALLNRCTVDAKPRLGFSEMRAHRRPWVPCDGKQPLRSDGSDHGPTSQQYGQEPEALHNHPARHQV